MSVPTIETARLRLRPLEVADVDALHALFIDPDVRRYLWDDVVVARDRVATIVAESLASFATDGSGLWGVRVRDEPALAGFCGYPRFHEPPVLELLYGMAPTLWGRGLATEAARAMIRYGFETLALARIEASIDPPNLASDRVLVKARLTRLGERATDGRALVHFALARAQFRPDAAPYRLVPPTI